MVNFFPVTCFSLCVCFFFFFGQMNEWIMKKRI